MWHSTVMIIPAFVSSISLSWNWLFSPIWEWWLSVWKWRARASSTEQPFHPGIEENIAPDGVPGSDIKWIEKLIQTNCLGARLFFKHVQDGGPLKNTSITYGGSKSSVRIQTQRIDYLAWNKGNGDTGLHRKSDHPLHLWKWWSCEVTYQSKGVRNLLISNIIHWHQLVN